MLTICPSRYRCRCPWSGRMFVVVAGTIVACLSEITTCTVEECTTSPFVGSTMLSVAVLLGLFDDVGEGVEWPGLAWLEHADSTTASATTANVAVRRVWALRFR